MTRETKIGILLVIVLAGVFGFLVYKKTIRPGEVVAKTEELTSEEESADDGTQSRESDGDDSFGFDDQEQEPPLMTAAASARPIPTDDDLESEDDLEDPFNTAVTSKPRLATMIPDRDDDEDEEAFGPTVSESSIVRNESSDLESSDPFAGPNETTTATDSDPFVAAEQPAASNLTVAIPADESEDDFAEPISLDAPTSNAARPLEISSDAPELGFEEAEATESAAFPAKEPSANAKPPIARLPVEDQEELLIEDDETVSIQVRTKLPQSSLEIGTSDEPQPLDSEADFESKEILPESSAPELMLDDADGEEEDRYGGYEPIELTSATFDAPATVEEGGLATEGPLRVSAESEPFAAPTESRRESPPISGARYVVLTGDNFWSISQRKYGTGRYFQALAASNQSHVPDSARMKPGVEIELPSAEDLEARFPSLIPGQHAEEPEAAAGASNVAGAFLRGSGGEPFYRVGSGDTLSGIAQKYLGRSRRWEQILEMNRDILKDGNTLRLGAVLRLPSDAVDVQFTSQPRLFR